MNEELTQQMSEVLVEILKNVNNALKEKDFENYKYWVNEWTRFFAPGNLQNLGEVAKAFQNDKK